MQRFDIAGTHTVTDANFSHYIKGTVHPDRVMGDHDFIYLLAGSWEIWQEGVPYQMEPHDLLILYAGKHHWGTRRCPDGTHAIYLHLRGGGENEAAVPADLPPLLHCGQHPAVERLMRETADTYLADGYGKEERLSALVCLLLLELCRCTGGPDAAEDDPAVQAARRIRQHPAQRFTATELADGLYLHPRTLENRFRRRYGKSICQFQLQTRLEAARTFLLDHPEEPLHSAAVNFGFYDEYHLSKAFKRQFGVSPARYRAEHR